MRKAASTFALVLSAILASPATTKPTTVRFEVRNAKVDFFWSSEAGAIAPLVRRFRSDLAREKTRIVECGRVFSRSFMGGRDPDARCESSTKITTSGQTSRLLSLARSYWAFTGGAHGNGATTGLLWDRKLNRQVRPASLFRTPQALNAAFRAPYCKALDAERKKRRSPDYKPSALVPEFDLCPELSKLELIPSSSKANGNFDRLHAMAAPYQVGSFAEGEYDIALPVTQALIDAVKPEYRSSFKAQRQ